MPSLFVGITPARHSVDPEKSNRVLELPALITGLCWFYGVSVAPSKVIRPPYQLSFHQEVLCPQAGAGRGTTVARGRLAAGNRHTATTFRVP